MSNRTDARQAGNRSDDGIGAKRWALIVCAVLLLLFFVLNLQKVKVHLLVATVEMPLVIALAIAALLGLLLGWAVPRFRRGGRDDTT
jgi:uncharacterized integral membrane protein